MASRSWALDVLVKLRGVPSLAGTEKRSPRATTINRLPSGAGLTDPDGATLRGGGGAMRSHAGIASTMFRTLSERSINIQVISTSEIKVSVLIASDYTELAVRALHTAYGLDVG